MATILPYAQSHIGPYDAEPVLKLTVQFVGTGREMPVFLPFETFVDLVQSVREISPIAIPTLPPTPDRLTFWLGADAQ